MPISIGVVSAGLMVWDIYNQRVARYMALPVWPNQTSEILFRLLNFPAYLAGPVTRAYHLYNPQHYFVLFPGCLVWWYVVGVVLDCGTGTRRLRSSWVWLSLALTLCLLALGIYVARSPWDGGERMVIGHEMRFSHSYGWRRRLSGHSWSRLVPEPPPYGS